MPLQPVPESPNQSSAPYKAPSLNAQRSRPTLAPFLSQAGNGSPPGSSLLKPYGGSGGTTRPGVVPPGQGLPQYSPQDLAQQCPPGCVTSEQAGANTWGGLIVGALVSGAAGALGGFLLARWIK